MGQAENWQLQKKRGKKKQRNGLQGNCCHTASVVAATAAPVTFSHMQLPLESLLVTYGSTRIGIGTDIATMGMGIEMGTRLNHMANVTMCIWQPQKVDWEEERVEEWEEKKEVASGEATADKEARKEIAAVADESIRPKKIPQGK